MKFFIIEYDFGRSNGLETSEVVTGETPYQAFAEWAAENKIFRSDLVQATAYQIDEGTNVRQHMP